ncbi:hypothetical protein [Streptomyces akebiae]|uniref:Uncharacterized protein n=1 Tax=Streptomyces akebiae TaxID=2865673 RepID=A0ABX8Y0Y8_9ACTN|nr:hypothetical protein [Streptomyces akebiae]QYX81850.1 hypothetical protein K1J60_39550 [Streptomyces akebiae]
MPGVPYSPSSSTWPTNARSRPWSARPSANSAGIGGIDGLCNVGADLSGDTMGRDTDLLGMDPAVLRRNHDVNLLGYALT